MNWTFVNILMLFGAIQGLVIVLILYLKKEDNTKARFYLSLMLFGLSMNLLYYFCCLVGLTKIIPILKLFYLPWALLSAISFYLYIDFISPFKKKITALNKLGFVPFLFFSIVLVIVNFNSKELPINLHFVNILYLVEEYFGVLFALIIGFLSYKKLTIIENQVQQQFSNYNKSKLQFHKRLIIVVLVFCVIWGVTLVYSQLNNRTSLSIYVSIWLFISFVIHWISWTGFIKDEALLPVFNNDNSFNYIKTSEITQNKIGLKLDKSNEHYKAMRTLFEEEQLFLDPELSLESLSNKLGISKSYLSALINKITNQNFYNFVNSYRTDYLVSLFREKKNNEYTILSLAYESGFNSKSTFQAFFKKYKGTTPSQFIKSLEQNEALGKV